MIRNDGFTLLEDPDVEVTGVIPPRDPLVVDLPRIDARLYEWVVNVRDATGVFVPADPNGPYSFSINIALHQLKVNPVNLETIEKPVVVQGYLVGNHRLLKAEHSGLTSVVVYYRAPGDTLDFTTYDWTLYRWRIHENREYVKEATSTYSIVKEADKVTLTLVTPVTSWISTRLLGTSPSSAPTPGGGEGRYKEKLLGVKNGVNLVYTTTQPFSRVLGFEENVLLNGVELEEGAGNDYLASESGGPGTGYDTITLAFAPLAFDKLEIQYVPLP